MHRNMNSACMFCHRSTDRLTNPPGGVGAETEAANRIEFLRGAYQSEIALLNKIKERDPMIIVALGNAHDEAQIGFNQPLLRVHIASDDPSGYVQLLLCCEQGIASDLS